MKQVSSMNESIRTPVGQFTRCSLADINNLLIRADEIDNRLGPIPGEIADDIAHQLRRAAKTIERLTLALKRYVDDDDPEMTIDDMPDGGCIECTFGTVQNDKNTGLCKFHQARSILGYASGIEE